MTIDEFKTKLDEWGRARLPFLFVIDFEMEKPIAILLQDVNPDELLFDCNGVSNISEKIALPFSPFSKQPISKEQYQIKFNVVRAALENGDSYLTNLTVKTQINGDIDLRALFHLSVAKYKLWMKDSFLVFSPESFVRIKDNRIYTYPMKGTIDAAIRDAKNKILNDRKELAEHVTIVDLLRNDLSMIAENVSVNRFRYVEELHTSEKTLLQVSSEITGTISDPYKNNLGQLIARLLPAGSVSGAPKPKTLEIIADAECEKRGYYTGVFGVFDGTQLDSAVMIRFVEQSGNEFFYRSGGGITTLSDVDAEYQEAIDKVYVPLD